MSNSAPPIFSGNGRLEQIETVFLTPVNAGVLLLPLKEYTEKYVRWYRQSLIDIEYLATWSIITPFRIGVTVKNIANYTTVASGELSVTSVANTLGEKYYFEGDETLSFNTKVNQQYEIEYSLCCRDGSANTYSATVRYVIAVVQNKYPLKKWTVTDVVNRCLELFEPLRGNENPRYRFDGVTYIDGVVQKPYPEGSQAEKYDKVLAPEFAMTKQTLREQLKQVGGFIHAEPRLNNGVIYFDEYGKGELSPIKNKRHISKQLSQDINEYCSSLDSQADNLVNRLDYAKGVEIEPSNNNFQTIRTESTVVRIEEGNGIIQTQRPIYEISKVLCRYPKKIENHIPTQWSEPVDISAYLFESAEYQNLSSFKGAYPFAKEYGLEYTQGSKNIKGLFYKSADITGGVISDYAIVKILVAEGVPESEIAKDGYYTTLAFQVSYTPIFSARIKTEKAICLGGKPRTLAYSQSVNLVETRYYGENLKGVVSRLGNIEKTLTYKVAFLTDIPKTGDMFDDDYYISAVSVEIQPFFIKVTVGLSKDFNRLSQYVGISSNLRLYEVSEKQSTQRDTVISDYLLISEDKETPDNKVLLTPTFTNKIKALFDGRVTNSKAITQALVRGRDINKNVITSKYAIALPVISSALGNTMAFTFNFADNYSAGQKIEWKEGEEKVKGYFGEYVPYANYYGRLYWLEFALYSETQSTEDMLIPQYNYDTIYADNEYTLPDKNVDVITTVAMGGDDFECIRYRKESTETPAITYQVSFVVKKGEKGFLIGSTLARDCALVNGTNTLAKLYVFPERLNVYDKNVDLTKAEEITGVTTEGEWSFSVDGGISTIDGKAWAYVTPEVVETIITEDENGSEYEQKIRTGGEIVVGRNIDIKKGDTVGKFYFTTKRKIYD